MSHQNLEPEPTEPTTPLEEENLMAWLPEPEWDANEPLRKVLGCLVPRQADLKLLHWESLFNQKVMSLAGNCPLPELLDLLVTYHPLQDLKSAFLLYLSGNPEQKKEGLDSIAEWFNLPGSNPVSKEEFRRELLNLSLMEFLELAS